MTHKPTKATISFDNGAAPIELPILSGSLGNDVIDIRSLGMANYPMPRKD
jgi:citrate synthase